MIRFNLSNLIGRTTKTEYERKYVSDIKTILFKINLKLKFARFNMEVQIAEANYKVQMVQL